MYIVAVVNKTAEKELGKFLAMVILAPIIEETFKVAFGYSTLGIFAGVLFGIVECAVYIIFQDAHWFSAGMSVVFHTATALAYYCSRMYEDNRFSKYTLIIFAEMIILHALYNLLTMSAYYVDFVNGAFVIKLNYFTIYSARVIPIGLFALFGTCAYKVHDLLGL